MKILFTCKFFFLLFINLATAQQSTIAIWQGKFDRGKASFEKGDKLQAVATLEQAYSDAQMIFKKNDARLRDSAEQLGAAYISVNRHNEALTTMQTALQVCMVIDGKTSLKYASYLHELSTIYTVVGQFAKAMEMELENLSIIENKFGKDSGNYGKILINMATLENRMGNYDNGIRVAIEALQNLEKNYGKQHEEYGFAQSVLSELYRRKGQLDMALPFALEASINIKKNLGENHQTYAEMLINLAGIYQSLGKYLEAFACNTEAIELIEKNLGKYNYSYGYILSQFGRLSRELGDYEKALSYYNESLLIIEKTQGKLSPSYAIGLSGIALLYGQMGQNDKVMPLRLEALSILEKSLGSAHSETIVAKLNLAGYYYDIREYDKALPILEDSKEVAENKLGKKSSIYGNIIGLLSQTYLALDQYDKALPALNESLQVTEETLGKDHFMYGGRLSSLAGYYTEMGNYDKALLLEKEALENAEKTLPSDHNDYRQRLYNLGSTYVKLGRPDDAYPIYIQSNEILMKQVDRIFGFSNENEKKAFLNTIYKNFEDYQAYNMATNGKYAEIQDMCMNNQLVIKELLLKSSKNVLSRLSAVKDKEIDSKILELRTSKRLLAKQFGLPVEKRTINIDSIKTEINLQESEIMKIYSKQFKRQDDLVKDWKSVRNKILKNEVVIEFSHFNYSKLDVNNNSKTYIAYIFKKNSVRPTIVNLFTEDQLVNILNKKSPNELYTRGSKAIGSATSAKASKELYDLIWKPIEKEIGDAETIYFSPDGLLHQIPFAALFDGKKILCQKHNLRQVSSTSILAEGFTEPTPTNSTFIGGIDYNYMVKDSIVLKSESIAYLEREKLKNSRGNHGFEKSWNYLPGTLEEVKGIESEYSKKGMIFKSITGSDANETNFKALSGNSPNIIHIATHGFFFENLKAQNDTRQNSQYLIADDPLIRSGLILSGANYAWINGSNPHEAEDGILTSLEISNLGLSKTDMVVLSACDTGLGDIDSSEGVYGLQRAFKIAGVKIIVMSLWQVPDAETAEFMKLFYGNWLKGKPVRDAFNKTQLMMQKKYIDEPLKWAGFVLCE